MSDECKHEAIVFNWTDPVTGKTAIRCLDCRAELPGEMSGSFTLTTVVNPFEERRLEKERADLLDEMAGALEASERVKVMWDDRAEQFYQKRRAALAAYRDGKGETSKSPQYEKVYTLQLTKREMDVAREWIAYANTVPSDHPMAEQDNETAERVIAKLEALGAKGAL